MKVQILETNSYANTPEMSTGTAVAILVLLYPLAVTCLSESKQLPNIVFILADDYGYNDVGYHGSEIKTPVLDRLAKEGVILENYYVQPICTPTRSTFLTGRYQIHTGLQHRNIEPAQANCVPLEETTIAQKLKESGYKAHAVGKWHNGFYKKECMPTNRGFDSFFGYLTGSEDYYSHIQKDGFEGVKPFCEWSGYDLRRNESVTTKEKGEYATFAFTKEAQKIVEEHDKESLLFLYLAFHMVHAPLQVPSQYLKQYQHIKDYNRRIYAGKVSAMDEAVGNLTQTLKEQGLWNNTILVFSTDNGGQPFAGGSSWPLRGKKGTMWEGGVKGVGFVSSPLLKNPGRVSHGMIHVSDWFPTFVAGIAHGSLNTTNPLDGFDVWETISSGAASPRMEILHNIDPSSDSTFQEPYKSFPVAAIRVGDWKLIAGNPGDPRWFPPPSSNFEATENLPPVDYEEGKIYLFNIANDPEECHELSGQYPDKVRELMSRIEAYNSTAVPVQFPEPDLRANPALHGGVWSPWVDDSTEA